MELKLLEKNTLIDFNKTKNILPLKINILIPICIICFVFWSCFTNADYSPDMNNGLQAMRYETNNDTIFARLTPPKGSIARGFLPFIYTSNDTGYYKAGLYLKSPIQSTTKNLNNGKRIFINMCSHCHGKTGNADGLLVRKGIYPPPGRFAKELKLKKEGEIYHSIYYGKNFMGSYKSQLQPYDIWQIIEYIKHLQNNKN